jgi:hypothetical protein
MQAARLVKIHRRYLTPLLSGKRMLTTPECLLQLVARYVETFPKATLGLSFRSHRCANSAVPADRASCTDMFLEQIEVEKQSETVYLVVMQMHPAENETL